MTSTTEEINEAAQMRTSTPGGGGGGGGEVSEVGLELGKSSNLSWKLPAQLPFEKSRIFFLFFFFLNVK